MPTSSVLVFSRPNALSAIGSLKFVVLLQSCWAATSQRVTNAFLRALSNVCSFLASGMQVVVLSPYPLFVACAHP